MTGTSWGEPSDVRSDGCTTPSIRGAPRKADRSARNGTVIEASGRQAPAKIHAPGATDKQARCTKAVFPTPASPWTTRVPAAPAAARPKKAPIAPSSFARPTRSRPTAATDSVTSQVSHHCGRSAPESQGFRRNSEGECPMYRGRHREQGGDIRFTSIGRQDHVCFTSLFLTASATVGGTCRHRPAYYRRRSRPGNRTTVPRNSGRSGNILYLHGMCRPES